VTETVLKRCTKGARCWKRVRDTGHLPETVPVCLRYLCYVCLTCFLRLLWSEAVRLAMVRTELSVRNCTEVRSPAAHESFAGHLVGFFVGIFIVGILVGRFNGPYSAESFVGPLLTVSPFPLASLGALSVRYVIIIINMLMPVQQNSFKHLSILLVLTDSSILA
jgi:hypothetical protein